MRRTMVALVAALLLSSQPSSATGVRGDWEIGVYGGYGWLDDYVFLRPKDEILYGARLGYFFTPNWSAEVSAQRLSTEKDTTATPTIDMNLDAIRLNGIYNFAPGSRFRPFLTAGVGYEITDVDPLFKSSDFGWNAGGGVRLFLTRNWSIRADGRFVQMNVQDLDAMQSNVEASAGISVLFGGDAGEPTAPPPANGQPTVSCSSDRAEILPGESATIVATGTDPDGDMLTYTWSTTAGRVTGSGTSATLDFTGVTAPATATVTVRAADGRGNTASSDCSVRLVEPTRPAESVSCLAGGFPRNLSRLTNVDKACLDDVVQRLKADPRARVIVIGHADGAETAAERLGEQRASAVKDYLVGAGIEASRITTRSAGATKPLETGAGNRRVEVWFVPEGATAPE